MLTLAAATGMASGALVAGSVRYGGVEGLRLHLNEAAAGTHASAVAVPAPTGPIIDIGPDGATATLGRVRVALPPTATPVNGERSTVNSERPAATGDLLLGADVPAPAIGAPVLAPAVLPTVTPQPIQPPITANQYPIALVAPASRIPNVSHFWQTWNNCGPATLAMYLSAYGGAWDQAAIGAALRRSEDDKNVSPEELVAYAQEQGYTAELRVNGSGDLLRAFLSNGIPVLVETWLEEDPNDGMGHYRLVVGHDDAAQQWTVYDSYVSRNLVAAGAKGSSDAEGYAGIYIPYAELDPLWQVFNRTYVLVYPPDKAPLVGAVLAAHAPDAGDDAAMWLKSEEQARAELAAEAEGQRAAFAWFNLGSSLWAQGRAAEAAAAFDHARSVGLPWRMHWYQFAPFATYHALGRNADVIALADGVLANTASIEEIHYWKGMAQAALGDAAAAQASFRRALDLYPGYALAAEALDALGG
jgi:hypothetical protein